MSHHSKPIGVAVAGYGYWGPNLVRNFQENADARVLVCCDSDERRLKSAKTRFESITTTRDFCEALQNPKVDALVIATPPRFHYEMARTALQHGKHVLVEKPLTTRVDHAEELCELAAKNGLVLQVDHVFIYSPPVQKMRDLAQKGELGKLFFIDSVRINLGIFQHDVNVVWDLAPHDLSIVDHVVGRMPVSVSAFGGSHAGSDIEDVAYLNLDYGDGLIASFHMNWLSPVKVRQMIMGGSKKSVIYDDANVSEKVKVYDRGIDIQNNPEKVRQALISYRSGDVWVPHLSNKEPLSQMVGDFIGCIQSGKKPLADGASGLRIVKILDAAQRSIKAQGELVRL